TPTTGAGSPTTGTGTPATGSGSSPADAGSTPTDAGKALGERLVEKVIGSARPSLLGHQRASFSLVVDAQGATLLRAAIPPPRRHALRARLRPPAPGARRARARRLPAALRLPAPPPAGQPPLLPRRPRQRVRGDAARRPHPHRGRRLHRQRPGGARAAAAGDP